MSKWLKHVEDWQDCKKCPLGEQRSNICLARGTIPAQILFIGEAPGVSEDALGRPFVGPAGDLLDAIIARAVPPEMTYALTNLVACFPREAKGRGDNEPEMSEIMECRPRLVEFVNIAQPKLIVCVGKLAAHYTHHMDTIPCVDIDHPAYILRMPVAQKGFAVQRCIVRVRNGIEDHILNDPDRPYRTWGVPKDASIEGKGKRRSVIEPEPRQLEWGSDDVPF